LFTVVELVGLEAEAGPNTAVTGSVNVNELEIELPEGWTSKWVSQQNGYGHQVEQTQQAVEGSQEVSQKPLGIR
jgi:hypothetical protein